jgi:hypothetical protein
MASSVTEIANSALIKLGGKVITSLDDPDKEAKLCKVRYPSCRRAVLRMHLWNCAIKRISLAPVATAPEHTYSYKFLLPGNCLRVLPFDSLVDEDFQVEGRYLLCNINAIDIRYIQDIDDVSLLDPLLEESIAWYLAWDISYALTQSNTVRQDAWQGFRNTLPKAKVTDAQEGEKLILEANQFLESRLTYAGRKAPNT